MFTQHKRTWKYKQYAFKLVINEKKKFNTERNRSILRN